MDILVPYLVVLLVAANMFIQDGCLKNLLKNGLEDMGRGGVRCDRVREWHGHIYTTKRKIDS